MKIFLFGTGDFYRLYKNWFRREDILGLIDNDINKRGTLIDGYTVYLPDEAVKQPFDYIVILSVYEEEMQDQLQKLGVAKNKICIFSELHRHPELLIPERPLSLYGSDKIFSEIMQDGCTNAVLLMAHDLDLNGATLALFYMAQILAKNHINVLFASQSDGPLRRYLNEEKVPLVIDSNLQIKTQKQAEWTHGFGRIVCNTINYYQFLSDRDLNCKVIWWLHEPAMFYKSLDQKLLHSLSDKNLTVYGVGPIAEGAFKKYFPDFDVHCLLYGIPGVTARRKPHDKLRFITIGRVEERKGQKILVQALKELDRDIKKQISVNIVGFKPSIYADEVKDMAKEFGEMVRFTPTVDREHIQGLLDESDVLVCPSIVDPMPVVCNEAMQHSLPCIVSDAAGNAAYIKDDENSFVVKAGDAKNLAEKITWCVKHQDELGQIGKNAKQIYEQNFSMDVFEKNVMKIVGNMVKEN